MLLVTGGAGFIGSNLVAALEARGERIAICDRLGSGEKWRNIAKRELEAIIDPDDISAFLKNEGKNVRAIFHMGAISATTERDADKLVEDNIHASQRLWGWATKENRQFIYASSAATYGDGAQGFDDDASLEHLAKLRPLNGYGWSKNMFDRWVARRLADGAARPLQWAGLKFFNVYGPNEYHKDAQASVIYHFYNQIKKDGHCRLFRSHHKDYADGQQLRDFVWVDDVVDAMLWLYDTRKVNGLFNVGAGKARSFVDVATGLFKALDLGAAKIDFVDMPEEIRGRYQYFTQAPMARLHQAGYDRPPTDLDQGLATYVRDYLEQDDPFR